MNFQFLNKEMYFIMINIFNYSRINLFQNMERKKIAKIKMILNIQKIQQELSALNIKL